MKSAIVTGAAGFIGTHLVGELRSHGVSVTSPGRGDIPTETADIFYHLAWEGASGTGRSDSVLQARNAELTLQALETAHKLGCGKFVALGTVYERFAEQIAESGSFGSSNFYILSKKYAHDMSRQLALKLGIDFIWITICHPIGRYIKPEQMMAYAVSNLLKGVSPAFGSATTLYDIAAVEDIARGLYLAGDCTLTKREYYIGSGNPRPLREWLEEARTILNVAPEIEFGKRPDDDLRFEREWFDTAPFTIETGYSPQTKFDKAVRNTAEWVKTL